MWTPRHRSIPVQVGPITIGGQAPIVVQSMTNTDTSDIQSTVAQAWALHQAGSELVRLTVNHEQAAQAVPHIRDGLITKGWRNPILIGDFHYNGHDLLTRYPACAEALSKYRINPGNVGFGEKHDKNFGAMIDAALRFNKPVRIGVNWGSLDQSLVTQMMDNNAKSPKPLSDEALSREIMITSALTSAQKAEQWGLGANQIILACKVSQVPSLVKLYQTLSQRCEYALHVGLTEAGMGSKGIVATTAALGLLLTQGIGDTIRASLTPAPGGDRCEEVRVCQEILQTLNLRQFSPSVSACPGCGRTTSTIYQQLAMSIQSTIQKSMPLWKNQYPGIETLKIAVMGCVVNGPGESKHADIGISLPGTGESPAAPVFIDGKKAKTLRGDDIDRQFLDMLSEYIQQRFSK